MPDTVLVLGAHGRLGSNAAKAFEAAGWTVRKFDRSRDDLNTAVRDVQVVVNGWNPPDYSKWQKELLPAHHRVIDAMRGSDATLILPGNVYVFGADTPGPWSPDTPHRATNPLGRLRIEMEAAYRASGLRVITVRAGDFLDTRASGNWFDKVMIAKLARGRFRYPGDPDIPHAWTYLPDMARAMVLLAERRQHLPRYADIPFPGYSLTGRQIAETLAKITHRDVRLSRMNWLPLQVLAPVWPMLRGLCEMRYLWNTPHTLDRRAFDALLPAFTETPVERALSQAIAHIPMGPGAKELKRHPLSA